MATKSTLLTNINGFITAVITQAKHRSSMLEVVNEIYPSLQTETTATNVICTSNANFTFDLRFLKTGRVVHIFGTIRNVSGDILGGGENVFQFNSTDFLPNQTTTFYSESGNFNISTIALTTYFQLSSPMGDNAVKTVSFIYATQD